TVPASIKSTSKTFKTLLECIKGTNNLHAIKSHNSPSPSPSSRAPTPAPPSENYSHLLEPLNETDYQNVAFWSYDAYREGEKNKDTLPDNINQKLFFAELADGSMADDERAKSIRGHARSFFQKLKNKGQAPETWGAADCTTKEDFRIHMYREFGYLRLCSHHWKVEFIATYTYPGWHFDHIEKPMKAKLKEEVIDPDGTILKVGSKRSRSGTGGSKPSKRIKSNLSVSPSPSPAPSPSPSSLPLLPMQPPIDQAVVSQTAGPFLSDLSTSAESAQQNHTTPLDTPPIPSLNTPAIPSLATPFVPSVDLPSESSPASLPLPSPIAPVSDSSLLCPTSPQTQSIPVNLTVGLSQNTATPALPGTAAATVPQLPSAPIAASIIAPVPSYSPPEQSTAPVPPFRALDFDNSGRGEATGSTP
ncbi:hypothetical protein SISSUDRAFT_1067782, partial [Sistotremastrum suecicum HHB10207 ss-3]